MVLSNASRVELRAAMANLCRRLRKIGVAPDAPTWYFGHSYE